MRIVVCDYAGHPFQVELSRCLARRGHAVLHLHFADLQAPKGDLAALPDDSPNFHVEGIATGKKFDKGRFLRRRLVDARVGRAMAARMRAFAPDVVVGCNMPLDAQKKLQRACATERIAFVFWLQDLLSQATYHFLGQRLGLLGRAIGRRYMALEASLLRSSDGVVAISERFLPPLEQCRVERRKVRVVPNWAPLSRIRPVEKDNPWARRHGLSGKLVALYSGTLGLKQDPTLLLGLARAGAEFGLHVVVVSEGQGADWLEHRRREEKLHNLLLLSFQPMDQYSEVLGTSDILVAMIGRESAVFSIPSKILSYLAAGRPVVASIAAENDAAQAIRLAQAGIVVEPGENAAFNAGVLRLAADAQARRRLGDNGRRFAEQSFDVGVKALQFEETFPAVSRSADERAKMSALEPASQI
jgi:glycosyltransferase involved in cell wall biosynthesis